MSRFEDFEKINVLLGIMRKDIWIQMPLKEKIKTLIRAYNILEREQEALEKEYQRIISGLLGVVEGPSLGEFTSKSIEDLRRMGSGISDPVERAIWDLLVNVEEWNRMQRIRRVLLQRAMDVARLRKKTLGRIEAQALEQSAVKELENKIRWIEEGLKAQVNAINSISKDIDAMNSSINKRFKEVDELKWEIKTLREDLSSIKVDLSRLSGLLKSLG